MGEDIEIDLATFEQIYDNLNDLLLACEAADDKPTAEWVRLTLEHMALMRRRYLGQEAQASHQVH